MAGFADILALPSRLSGGQGSQPSQAPAQRAPAQPSASGGGFFASILALPSKWGAMQSNAGAMQSNAGAMQANAGKKAPAMQANAGGAYPSMAAISYKDPSWNASEAAASEKTGVPAHVLSAIRLHGERSNGNQVSPKGARGVYQFIPSTRAAFLKKYGVDAYSADQNEQAMATALHLKESYARTKDWGRAMAGFNGGISGERGTNKTSENAGYLSRTTQAIAPQKVSSADEFSDAWERDAFAQQDPQEQLQNFA